MAAPYEMKKLYQEGRIGEFEYGECEYVHNCEPDWPSLAYGDKNHWRNRTYATYYCTHSLGPIIHMTGLRPVSVIGIEGTKRERKQNVGSLAGMLIRRKGHMEKVKSQTICLSGNWMTNVRIMDTAAQIFIQSIILWRNYLVMRKQIQLIFMRH